jgi:hypothetical protein
VADDLSMRGGQDRRTINLHQDFEVRDWSSKFGVTADELREAVAAVGNQASKVEEYLRSRKK